jgi:hypothetical protein
MVLSYLVFGLKSGKYFLLPVPVFTQEDPSGINPKK